MRHYFGFDTLQERFTECDRPAGVAGLVAASFGVWTVVAYGCPVFMVVIDFAGGVVCFHDSVKVFAISPRVINLALIIFF